MLKTKVQVQVHYFETFSHFLVQEVAWEREELNGDVCMCEKERKKKKQQSCFVKKHYIFGKKG